MVNLYKPRKAGNKKKTHLLHSMIRFDANLNPLFFLFFLLRFCFPSFKSTSFAETEHVCNVQRINRFQDWLALVAVPSPLTKALRRPELTVAGSKP